MQLAEFNETLEHIFDDKAHRTVVHKICDFSPRGQRALVAQLKEGRMVIRALEKMISGVTLTKEDEEVLTENPLARIEALEKAFSESASMMPAEKEKMCGLLSSIKETLHDFGTENLAELMRSH